MQGLGALAERRERADALGHDVVGALAGTVGAEQIDESGLAPGSSLP